MWFSCPILCIKYKFLTIFFVFWGQSFTMWSTVCWILKNFVETNIWFLSLMTHFLISLQFFFVIFNDWEATSSLSSQMDLVSNDMIKFFGFQVLSLLGRSVPFNLHNLNSLRLKKLTFWDHILVSRKYIFA